MVHYRYVILTLNIGKLYNTAKDTNNTYLGKYKIADLTILWNKVSEHYLSLTTKYLICNIANSDVTPTMNIYHISNAFKPRLKIFSKESAKF